MLPVTKVILSCSYIFTIDLKSKKINISNFSVFLTNNSRLATAVN